MTNNPPRHSMTIKTMRKLAKQAEPLIQDPHIAWVDGKLVRLVAINKPKGK